MFIMRSERQTQSPRALRKNYSENKKIKIGNKNLIAFIIFVMFLPTLLRIFGFLRLFNLLLDNYLHTKSVNFRSLHLIT